MVNYKHGGFGTRLYRIREGMISRCQHRPNYIKKGITVCLEWQNDFVAFREWALSHDYNDTLVIHRRKHHLGYNPKNCEWITKKRHDKWHYNFRSLKIRSKRFLIR